MTLRIVINAPMYLRNANIHRELGMPTIDKFCREMSSTSFDTSTANFNSRITQAKASFAI